MSRKVTGAVEIAIAYARLVVPNTSGFDNPASTYKRA
jgi:hypothetical protein